MKNALYQTLYEHAPDGIVVVEQTGMIGEINPAACAMFGYEAAEVVGQPIEILVPDSAKGGHREHRDRFMGDEPRPRPMGIGMELRAQRKDGSTFPVEISLAPLSDKVGGGAIATVRDVSLRRRMQDFSIGALRAAEDVRASISRDLHDDTAQQLAALMIHLRLLERATDPADRSERIAVIRTGLEDASDGIRRIARGLRPPELEDAGLAAALAAHVRQLRETRSLTVVIDVEPIDERLKPDSLLVLYRVVQEALSNVAEHAGVDVAHVHIREEGDQIHAEIKDEGTGFAFNLATGDGLGLIGMHERAAMIGGRLTVTTRPGEGTRIRFSIPVDFKLEPNHV